MSFYKIIGAVLIVLCGGSAASHMNRRLSGELSELEAWLMLVGRIKTDIECYSRPISEILSENREILFRCGYTGELPKDLEELVSACDVKNKRLAELLSSFSSEFGRSYREEQVARCQYYESELDALRHSELDEISKKKKLNTTLCISGSLAIAILLL